jgi:hypothetical protein
MIGRTELKMGRDDRKKRHVDNQSTSAENRTISRAEMVLQFFDKSNFVPSPRPDTHDGFVVQVRASFIGMALALLTTQGATTTQKEG